MTPKSLEQFKLTKDEQANICLKEWGEPFNGIPTKAEFVRAVNVISDTATRKALRGVVQWLRAFEGSHSLAEDFIAIGRGHGLDMAAEELERMAAETQS